MNSMYNSFIQLPPGVRAGTRELTGDDVLLQIRQHPYNALVCQKIKEKARKPVDPPPVVEMRVPHPTELTQHYLSSPYLFMACTLLKPDHTEVEHKHGEALAGTRVSSLYRLKDTVDGDKAFFVFGDLSVRITGRFTLRFSLFELRKDLRNGEHWAQYLGSVISECFKVCQPKEWGGMKESSRLSHAFSDQGVRIRLRKEPRTGVAGKRPYNSQPDDGDDDSQADSSPVKRQRHSPDADLSTVSRSTSYIAPYAPTPSGAVPLLPNSPYTRHELQMAPNTLAYRHAQGAGHTLAPHTNFHANAPNGTHFGPVPYSTSPTPTYGQTHLNYPYPGQQLLYRQFPSDAYGMSQAAQLGQIQTPHLGPAQPDPLEQGQSHKYEDEEHEQYPQPQQDPFTHGLPHHYDEARAGFN